MSKNWKLNVQKVQESKKETIMAIKDTMLTLLANNFAYYILAQGYHWNVTGDDFVMLHDFFGRIYDDLDDANDVIAEQMRAMDVMVPAGLAVFDKHRTIPDGAATDCDAMLMDLSSANDEMLKVLDKAFKESEAQSSFGLSDFLAGRIDAHKKHGWMLKASLEKKEDMPSGPVSEATKMRMAMKKAKATKAK